MNKIIKDQLAKTSVLLPEYNDSTTQIIIPKAGLEFKPQLELIAGHRYRIEVANYVINEPPNFTLSANWNKGTKPPENILWIYVYGSVGNMIEIESVGDTTDISWRGYLPRKSITILEEIHINE